MRGKHIEAKNHRIKLRSHIPHGKEVPERLRHLLVVNVNKGIVHPVAGKLLSVCRLILGNLIFMMRENEVLSARMNV